MEAAQPKVIKILDDFIARFEQSMKMSRRDNIRERYGF